MEPNGAPATTASADPRPGAEATPAAASASGPSDDANPGPAAEDATGERPGDGTPASASPVATAIDTPPVRARYPFALGAAGLGAVGLGGPAEGLGGGVEGVWFPSALVGVRLAAEARNGAVKQLPGADAVFSGAVGLEWWALRFGPRGVFGAGLRADVLLLRHQVRTDGDDSATPARAAETLGRFLLGADLSLLGEAALAERLTLVLGAGVEAALGQTELRTVMGPEPITLATIPALRAIGRVGLRWGF